MNGFRPAIQTFPPWRYALLTAAGFVFVAIAANFCMALGVGWACPMRVIFHIPCPSCGSTRALAALSRFEFFQALRFNPLLTISLPVCLAIPFLRKNRTVLSIIGWPIFCGALFLNWLYLLFYLPP